MQLSWLYQALATCGLVTATSPPELTLPAPIRITFFLTKNPNITEAEFHDHWSNHHGPLVSPWLKQYGVLEYNQVRIISLIFDKMT